ncbi:MAG: hypothetical protein ACRC8S_14970 [Fimbriiglobus sp.]
MTPNLQQIANQTQEFAKHTKDHRLGLVFQTVSMVSMAVLGVGAAVHLLREMLRNPRHHDPHHDNHDRYPAHSHSHAHEQPQNDYHEDHGSMTRHARHRSQHHGHGRGG